MIFIPRREHLWASTSCYRHRYTLFFYGWADIWGCPGRRPDSQVYSKESLGSSSTCRVLQDFKRWTGNWIWFNRDIHHLFIWCHFLLVFHCPRYHHLEVLWHAHELLCVYTSGRVRSPVMYASQLTHMHHATSAAPVANVALWILVSLGVGRGGRCARIDRILEGCGV
jgi:hypothetical protein